MEFSKYNYLFYSNKVKTYLLYNSLSNSLMDINKVLFEVLTNIKNKHLSIEELDKTTLQKLVSHKVFVDNDLDEIVSVKYHISANRFNNQHLSLTLNPTLSCNFACKYCFEDNKNKKVMAENTEKKLISFIKSYKNAKHLGITWFGGEPLLAFDNICRLTEQFLKLKKSYNAFMITNGSLFTIDKVKKLDSLKIGKAQITIDGLKEIHDTRRPLKNGQGTFDKIIENIGLLMDNSSISIDIRVNIDETNSDSFFDVFNYISTNFDNYKNRLIVYPGFIQNINACSSASGCSFDRNKKVEFFLNLRNKYGIALGTFFPQSYIYECAVRNINCFTIGPEGEIYKCWNDVGLNDKVIANIHKKGIINKTLLTRYYAAADPLSDKKCLDCFHFPTCDGGCPYQRIEALYNDKDIDNCALIKDNIETFIENHYKLMKGNKNE